MKRKALPSRSTQSFKWRVRQYLEKHEMTMAEFVTLALQDELHPKFNIQEDNNMSNMRTLAFQVLEELFQKIKEYLQRNNMTQKEFVIGLIENEIERDLSQRAEVSEAPTDGEGVTEEYTEQEEEAAVSDPESASEEVGEEPEEQENTDFSNDFDGENEDEDIDEEQDEVEDVGMAMVM